MSVSNEAVEVAARWLWAHGADSKEWGRSDWEDDSLLDRGAKQDARNDARELLEAAAPHMLAAAWEDGCNEGLSYNPGYDDEARAQNPYRSTDAG